MLGLVFGIILGLLSRLLLGLNIKNHIIVFLQESYFKKALDQIRIVLQLNYGRCVQTEVLTKG